MRSVSAYSVHLDAIRGLAALVVFSAHARNIFFGNIQSSPVNYESSGNAAGAFPGAAVPAALGIGHHAVIVFFVLSGHLVGTSVIRGLQDGRWSWRRYLTHRLTRLWVVLLPALLVGFCLDHIGLHMFGDKSLYLAPAGQSVIQHPVAERLGASTLAANAAFLQTILASELGSNVALWSLANEFWYYIAFPLLAILLWRSTKSAGRIACVLTLVALTWFVGAPIGLYFVIWLFGVAASYIPRVPQRISRAVTLGGVALFLVTSVSFRRHAILPPYAADVVLGAMFSVVLYGCLHERHGMRDGVYASAAQALSGMSYTLYLVHLPALVFCSALLTHPYHGWVKDPPHFVAFGIVLLIVFAYAFTNYYLFERNTDRVRALIGDFRHRPVNAAPEVFA
jgi:peptidoglycan/LPS O-acetylase OafA/YrhL